MKTKEVKDKQQTGNKEKWHIRYIELCEHIAKWSNCTKLQVASVIVNKQNRIVTTGVNGTLAGLNNKCEEDNGMTKFSSYHSEENSLLECLRQGKSTVGCIIYCSHFPCPQCSKLICGAGITHVYYRNDYRDMNGMELFKLANIKIKKI